MKFVKVLAACALSVAVVAAVSCKKEPAVDPENPEETPQENPEVKVPDGAVDLGLSVFWATCNLGADIPEASGNLYPFGSTKPVKIESGNVTSMEIVQDFKLDENGNLEPGYDCAHAALGGKWRMPTNAELLELFNNCDLNWCSIYDVLVVDGDYVEYWKKGLELTSKKNGNSIFLNITGYAENSNYYGGFCYYWTSTYGDGKEMSFPEPLPGTGAYYLHCQEWYEEYDFVWTSPEETAMAVRPVHPKE